MIFRLVQKIAAGAMTGLQMDALQKPLVEQLKLSPSVAARAVAYIRTGDDRPVLSALGAHQAARRYWNYQEIGVFCGGFPGAPDQLARLVEVFSAALNMAPSRSSYNKEISAETPDFVANLFQFLASRQHRQALSNEDPPALETSFQDLMTATDILGGTPADLITFIVPCNYGRAPFSLQGQTAQEFIQSFAVSDYITSLDRRPAGDRAKVLGNLRAYPVVKDPAFLPYLLDCAAAKSAKLQEIAVTMLQAHDPANVLAGARPMLNAKAAATRAGAARAIGRVGTEEALALLRAREEVEKAQNVLAIIKHFTDGVIATATDAPEGTYEAIDGSFVALTAWTPLVDDGAKPLGKDDLATLEALDDKHHAKRMDYFKERLARHHAGDRFVRVKPTKPTKLAFARQVFDLFNGPPQKDKTARGFDHRARHLTPALEQMATRLSDARIVALAVNNAYALTSMLGRTYGVIDRELMRRVQEGQIDIRQIVAAAEETDMLATAGWRQNKMLPASEANLIRALVADPYPGDHGRRMKTLWPITASHLDVIMEALPPQTTEARTNLNALEMLADLPKLPIAAVEGVFFAALDDRARISRPAQALLQEAEGIDERVIAALKDKRQAVRASAARFLADRDTKEAIKPLVARLKAEKSESARAQMIAALSRLGGDTTLYLGREGLMTEAEALVKKLPNAKIEWLKLEAAPALAWADGTPVDPVIPDAWLRLAVKLKDPAEALLFNLYLDQIDPAAVTAFADWVLNSWMSYDAQQPPLEETRKQALAQAKQYIATHPQSYKNRTAEELAASILPSLRNTYANSGSESKGILALTHRAPPAKATASIAAYLKKHGKRVSQAKTLVDVLYGMQSPEALQVLVATATRFKQRTVRELAEQRVGQIAEQRGWSQDELADRSVPTGGIEEDGVLTLEVGEEAKPYRARLDSDLSLKLFNPTGKEVKAIPAGKDDNTKESKALLSAAKKTVKAAVAQQSNRLYDGMVAGRKWRLADWERDFVAHPIMTRLIERIIWRGLAEDGSFVTAFRPTAEGDRLTADGDDADLSAVRFLDIAHTTTLPEDQRAAWMEHLDDFEINPLFPQITRPQISLSDGQKKLNAIEDRKGWLTDTFTLRGKAAKAGFDRGEVVDGGSFFEYVKDFRSAGIHVVLEFTGSYLPEENIPAAIVKMVFFKRGGSRSSGLPLSQVPPMVLSEAWNDLYEIASVAAFDKDWESKGLY